MKTQLLIICCILTLIIGSCKQPTANEFNRTSPYDPDSPIYELSAPTQIKISLTNDKEVILKWEDSDTTGFVTGIIIRKSITGLDSDFKTIDTLSTEKNTYTDTSQVVQKKTKYLISHFRDINSGINESETLISGIDFGTIKNSYAEYNSETSVIEYNWEYETLWPFVSVLYLHHDGLNEPVPLDTVFNAQSEYTTPEIEKDFRDREYILRSFINEADINNDDFIGEIVGKYTASDEFQPTITHINVLNESEVVINWSDNSNFEEGFEIIRNHPNSGESQVFNVDTNTTTFVDSLNPFRAKTTSGVLNVETFSSVYNVRAFKGETSVISNSETASIQIHSPILSFTESDDQSITFSWSINDASVVEHFILQRSEDGDNYNNYRTFPNNVFSYTDTDLDLSKEYYYRLKTKIKRPIGFPLYFSYMFDSEEIMTFDYKNASTLQISKNDKYLVAASGYDSNEFSNRNEVVIYDLESNTEAYRINPFNAPVDGIDVNEERNWLAMASRNVKSMQIRDFIADTIVYQVSEINIHDIEMSPDGLFAYAVDELGNFIKFDAINKSLIFTILNSDTFQYSAKRRVSVSPTGDTIAVNRGHNFKLFDPEGNQIDFNALQTPSGNTSNWVNISNTGKYIVSSREYLNPGRTHLQNLDDASVIFYSGGQTSVDFNNNDTIALFISRGSYYLIDINNIRVISAEQLFDDFSNNIITSAYSNNDPSFFISNPEGIKRIKTLDVYRWKISPYKFHFNPPY